MVTGAGTTNEAMAGMGLMLQNQNLAAQRDLIKAQTNNVDADTANKTGIERLKTETETASLTQGIENQKAVQALTEAQSNESK